jgi:hypothetical protein
MKTKDNYKGTNQWLVLSDPTEMKEKYFFSWYKHLCRHNILLAIFVYKL